MAALTDAHFAQLQQRLASCGVDEIHRLPGGASSLTFIAMRADQRVVVKVAPPGVPPTLNRDVLRQARMIRVLGPSAVPVPEVLWEDEGDPPEVPPFFLMSHMVGDSLEPLFDHGGATPDVEVVADRLRNAARAMAQLHRIEPAAVGLSSEPVITLSEEISRWCRLLETVDSGLAAGWQDVAALLRSCEPAGRAPALCHGDFRLGNLLATGSRIAAVIDWEIWSVGDPRVDAGWFLVNADPETYSRTTAYSGYTPPPIELAAIYADTLGCVVPEMNWFQALACFKSTATWSLIIKHNRRRPTSDIDAEEMAPLLPRLLARATEFLTQ